MYSKLLQTISRPASCWRRRRFARGEPNRRLRCWSLPSQPTSEIPASVTPAQTREVRRLAVEAFLAVDAAGMGRIDFLLDGKSGQWFVSEINTIPGFTTISMYPKLWGATGLAYPALLDRLIELAIERHAEKQDLRTTVP